MRVLGKAMTVDPRKWKYSHSTTSVVGLGAGNNEQMVASLQGIYGIQQQLKAQGSELVDSKDIYNTLKRIVDGLGMPRVDEFFNDPEKPEELLQAQNEILQQSVQQLQQMVEQLQNPLADAEMVKREGELKIANDKLLLDVAKLEEDRRQFNVSAAQKETDSERKTATDLTALELKHGQDIEGALV
jgi:thioesterase domain-containing protein